MKRFKKHVCGPECEEEVRRQLANLPVSWENAMRAELAHLASIDMVIPSGICQRCGKPLDDHKWDKQGPLCPKVTA